MGYIKPHKNTIDISGKTFSEWKVLGYVGKSLWECECSCGNIKQVASKSLRLGISKSCGHNTKNAKHIIGNKYGEWEVIKHSGYRNNRNYWECICSCGTIAIKDAFTLTSGHSKSCGHDKLNNITGKQFGELKAQEYIGNKQWKCICSCGKERIVTGRALRRGTTVSCGDTIHKIKNIKDAQFGELTAIEYIGKAVWKCKCLCGNYCNIETKHLLSGNRKTCGHEASNKLIELKGKIFGSLEVIEYNGNRQWKCKCLCGKITYTYGQALTNGLIQSCGCKKAELIRETLLERYNEVATVRINNPREIWQLEIVENAENMARYIKSLGYKPTSFELEQLLDTDRNVILKKIHKYKIEELVNIRPLFSKGEIELYDYIKSLMTETEILQNYRKIQGITEIDIYIPSKALAIEFNGTYWHSTIYKDINYHQCKTINAAKHGIKLVHIFEYEWEINKEKTKAYIKNILTDKIEIYAVDTIVGEIENIEATLFISKYHMHKVRQADINIGLRHNGEIVAVITTCKTNINNIDEYEIITSCFKSGIRIVGGLKKLFKYLVDKYKTQYVKTYCDISKFTGNSYLGLGFKTSINNMTKPNYKLVNHKTNDVISEYQINEDELIKDKHYLKIYDSGNLVLTWKKNR